MALNIDRFIVSRHSSDGDGVKIRRVGLFNEADADPFLMLDELSSDNVDDFIGGFPPHPHRGMETLTYLKYGSLTHQDHMGNTGKINSGGAQWMSAGRGIIHSEMPSRELDKLHGFQLWINLPANQKMSAPKYQDIPESLIPHVTTNDGHTVRAIAGNWNIDQHELNGPLQHLAAESQYLDIELCNDSPLTISIPPQHRCIIMVYDGIIETIPTSSEKSLLVIPLNTDTVVLKTNTQAKMLLLTGKPIKEPVVHYGPFVMNTMEEIQQAIADYRSGRFGTDK